MIVVLLMMVADDDDYVVVVVVVVVAVVVVVVVVVVIVVVGFFFCCCCCCYCFQSDSLSTKTVIFRHFKKSMVTTDRRTQPLIEMLTVLSLIYAPGRLSN